MPNRIPTRRTFLADAGGGLGMLALGAMMAGDANAAATDDNPLAPQWPHMQPRAKRVLWRFMHGDSVNHPQSVYRMLLNAKHRKVSPKEADHYRRSGYVFVRRNLHFPIFAAFDRPDGNASCARGSRSTTAPQKQRR
jgi:hypothetical protein